MKFIFAFLALSVALALSNNTIPEKKQVILSVFIGNDTTINCNKLLDLTALVDPANAVVTYSWKLVSAPTLSAYTATSPDKKNYGLNFSQAGVYVFSVTVTENGTSAEARDEISINVNCNNNPPPPPPSGNTNFKYIRMFSPNNDGINDTWKIEGASGGANITVAIYNQHGKEVYSLKNPATDVIWDGKIKGNPAPSDTYYFVVWKDGKKILGDNITLLR